MSGWANVYGGVQVEGGPNVCCRVQPGVGWGRNVGRGANIGWGKSVKRGTSVVYCKILGWWFRAKSVGWDTSVGWACYLLQCATEGRAE